MSALLGRSAAEPIEPRNVGPPALSRAKFERAKKEPALVFGDRRAQHLHWIATSTAQRVENAAYCARRTSQSARTSVIMPAPRSESQSARQALRSGTDAHTYLCLPAWDCWVRAPARDGGDESTFPARRLWRRAITGRGPHASGWESHRHRRCAQRRESREAREHCTVHTTISMSRPRTTPGAREEEDHGSHCQRLAAIIRRIAASNAKSSFGIACARGRVVDLHCRAGGVGGRRLRRAGWEVM